MIIPKKPDDRDRLVQDVIQQCELSQQERLAANSALRNYVLFGSDQPLPTNYNKIYPTLDLLKSFLYAQESVNFSIKFGVGVSKEQTVYGFALRDKMHEIWEDSGTDALFADAVFWSLAYNSYVIKTIWNGGIRTYGVNPHMIGVYREDIPSLDNQEAITHLYYTTKSGLRNTLSVLPVERRNDILNRVSTLGPPDESNMPATVANMIITSTQPNITGSAQPNWSQRYSYKPEVSPELLEMREAWIYDDELEDYRVFTIANPNVYVFDRRGSTLCTKGEHPFVKVTPFPLMDYFWGLSLAQNLTALQDWHDGHLKRVDQVFRRKLRPSRIFSGPGWSNLTDEKMLALDREGGFMNNPTPAAKVDKYAPEVQIQEALLYLHQLDQYFNEMAGVGGNIMRAEGDEGVRSMQHAQILARMGSSRIKQTALRIEDPAEKLATLMLKMQAEHDEAKYLDETEKEFLLSQVTKNYQVKVSGHSLSPVFVEDTKEEAKYLLGTKQMTRKSYIEETKPPMQEELLRDVEKIEKAEAENAKVQMGLQLLKAAKK